MPESNRDEIAKLEALYATNPAGRVFTHLAEAYRKAGEYDRARAILEQGLEKHPTYASAHVVFGRVLMDLNKSDEAVEAFRKVLQLDPHNLVALRSLGDLARSAGRNAEAMGYFEELRHLDPSNEDISGIIADLLASPDFHAAVPAEPLPELKEPEPRPPSQPEAVAQQSETSQPVARQPTPEAAPGEPIQPMAAASEEPSGEATAYAEAPPEEPAPEAQIEELIAQTPEPEWGAVEPELETLPGDLADFARQNAPSDPEEWGAVQLEDLPAEIPLDLGPSDAAIEVPPEETFKSLDVSDIKPEEEPAFEEVASAETTLEAMEPEGEAIVPEGEAIVPEGEAIVPEGEAILPPIPAFEPAPEVLVHTPIDFEPAEVFEPPAPTFEAPAEPEAVEPVEARELFEAFEPAVFEEAQQSEPDTPTPGLVVTETMAELYWRQGLHDRASQVFRALLRQRPGDPRLTAKLKELEAEMSGAAPEAPPAFEAAVEPEFEAPLPFLSTAPEAADAPDFETVTSPSEEDVPSPWTGFNAAAANAPSLYAFQEEAHQAEAEASATVSEYFRALLAWRPANAGQSSFVEQAPEAAEPDTFDLGRGIDTSQQPMFEEPIAGREAGNAGMPWEESGALPGAISGQTGADDEFDDWFSAEPPPEEAEAQRPAAATPQSLADDAAPGDEEDDDLEMFRSWLQSLKK